MNKSINAEVEERNIQNQIDRICTWLFCLAGEKEEMSGLAKKDWRPEISMRIYQLYGWNFSIQYPGFRRDSDDGFTENL